MSGAQGPRGHTGATGRKGLQGTPYGAPGTTFYSTSGRVNVITVVGTGAGTNALTLTTAGDLYAIQSQIAYPTFTFPSNLTSNQYGTFWTITNQYTTEDQKISITSGILNLTISGSVLNCPQGTGVTIDVGLAPGQSITFVFFAGSGATAEYIAF